LRPKHVEWLCRNKTCTVLHQVGVSFDLYYDARKHKIKIYSLSVRRENLSKFSDEKIQAETYAQYSKNLVIC
jgi:hypothetical protein